MFSRSRNWVPGGLWKPKNPHSLEHLKYLYTVLTKNQNVTEQNRALLVETLRSISEILIWGDQNDSTVFDFFLEKNMLSFFLQFMKQKYGRYICVQLLQTLNILFENISNETSVYYLLSNNHVNSIIVHKFDFSDEEVMAYYISFLKTLSLRLNKHTIHFFYNEHTNDFPLYTEGIKFFNHSETMVRIAVRTITLNVYKACTFVDDKSMLRYIRDKTAAPYFSNLVWFIGNNVLDLDACVRHDTDHNSKDRLADLVAEHLDHLHYLNDILCLNIDALNEVLTDHLLNNLFLPLYVYSLTKSNKYALRSDDIPHISPVVSLFLLSQVFLIMQHKPLVRQLADIIFNSDLNIFASVDQSSHKLAKTIRGFIKPREPLAKTLDKNRGTGGTPMRRPNYRNVEEPGPSSQQPLDVVRVSGNSIFYEGREPPDVVEGRGSETGPHEDQRAGAKVEASSEGRASETEGSVVASDRASETDGSVVVSDRASETEGSVAASDRASETDGSVAASDITADESEMSEQQGSVDVAAAATDGSMQPGDASDTSSMGAEAPYYRHLTDDEKLASQGVTEKTFTLQNRPYLTALFSQLSCRDNDYGTLFSLCLLYAVGHNPGLNQELLDTILLPTSQSQSKHHYNTQLMEALITIIGGSCTNDSRVRIATLELCIKLLVSMVMDESHCFLQDAHLAAVEGAREEATLLLRNFYKVWEKSEEIFLDMFEDEYREMKIRPLNVEYLTMDASILLPPTGTPLTGIGFIKRLPCGEVERARKAIRVFFYLRELSVKLRQQPDTDLPLTKQEECVKVGDVLDLNNSDLIACTVINKDQNKKERRFLVIDVLQLILVEPDSRKLGWGLVKFVGFLQDVEVTGDKEDSRSLYVTIHKPTMNVHAKPMPLLAARFVFDDHIRCMAAKQRLTKGRLKARQRKMQMIARLLELPAHIVNSMYHHSGGHLAQASVIQHAGSPQPIPGRSHQVKSRPQSEAVKRSVFAGVDQTAAFSASRIKQKQKASRNVPAAALRRSAGKIQRVEQSTGSSPGKQNIERGGIEEAEEAETSLHTSKSETRKTKRVSKYYSQPSVPSSADIQLDEMSVKANNLLIGTRELFKDSRQQLQSSRSMSSSPQRKAGSQSGSRSSSVGSNKSRGSTECLQAKDHNDTSPRTEHRLRRTRSDSPSALKSGPIPDFYLPSHDSSHENMDSTPRRTSASGPKTLTPARAPTASLVVSCDIPVRDTVAMSALDSPHLIPPSDRGRIRSYSEPPHFQHPTGSSISIETGVICDNRDSNCNQAAGVSKVDQSSEIPDVTSDSNAKEDQQDDDTCRVSDQGHDAIGGAVPIPGQSAVDKPSSTKGLTIGSECVADPAQAIMRESPPITADLSHLARMAEEDIATERLTKRVRNSNSQSLGEDAQAVEMTSRSMAEQEPQSVEEASQDV